MSMIRRWNQLPVPLQRLIIIRGLVSASCLLLFVIVLALVKSLTAALSLAMLSIFFGISAWLLYKRLVDGKYVAVAGVCSRIECSAVRKKVKAILVNSEDKCIKLNIRQRMGKLSDGDTVVIYILENTPVYEEDDCLIPAEFLTIEIMKGRSKDVRGK